MYKVNELIKCCKMYPEYKKKPATEDVWLECKCCRKRTVNTFNDYEEAGRVWNEMMLKVRDPRRSIQGKAYIMSMLDEQHLTPLEVAEKADIKKSQVGVTIHRIRKEFEEMDEIYEGGDPGTATVDEQTIQGTGPSDGE